MSSAIKSPPPTTLVPNLDLFESRLGYKFVNHSLLKTALTHRSFKGANNERLEFLGDSILGFLIAEKLYQQFPNADEGELTQIRARLVCGSTLATVARELNLRDYIFVGEGELKSEGFDRTSILADAIEALLGAIYLDGGFDATKRIVLKQFASRLTDISLENIKDNKTMLQELLQKQDKPLPVYEITKQSGKPHAPIFEVKCDIDHAQSPFYATGSSRRRAEQKAAKVAIEMLNKLPQ